jgi:hypothetical protein
MRVKIMDKGKFIGYGNLPEIETKPAEPKSIWKLDYPTTKNGVGDFEDCTKAFKTAFKKHEQNIRSHDSFIQNKAGLDLLHTFEAVAGRKLTTQEHKNIAHHCKRDTPRMKINKYGRLFGKRIPNKEGASDIWYKEWVLE